MQIEHVARKAHKPNVIIHNADILQQYPFHFNSVSNGEGIASRIKLNPGNCCRLGYNYMEQYFPNSKHLLLRHY